MSPGESCSGRAMTRRGTGSRGPSSSDRPTRGGDARFWAKRLAWDNDWDEVIRLPLN